MEKIKIILRNDPAKQRKKLGKVKDLSDKYEADKEDRLYKEWVDDEAIRKSMTNKKRKKQ